MCSVRIVQYFDFTAVLPEMLPNINPKALFFLAVMT